MSEGEVPHREIRNDAPITREVEKPLLDAILVFGQGPVVERETKERASEAGKEQGSEDVNLWSKTLAEAASELYKRGQTREIIIMGGRTGGEVFQSEAELIAKLLREQYNVPSEVIKLEGQSTNTLENIVNLLNDYIDIEEKYKNIGMLTSNFHLPRVRLLIELFGIPYKHAFSAEEVVRYVAREGKEWEKWDQGKLLEIERRLDMSQASKTPISERDKQAMSGYDYYHTKKGMEQENVARRGQKEDVWSRALLKMPEYWLSYLGKLNNANRIREILTKQDQEMLKNRFGINPLSDADDSIREKLLTIERKLPDLKEWTGREWDPQTVAKLEELIEQRKQLKIK